MRLLRPTLTGVLLVLLSTCTYGPEEERSVIGQVVRPPGSYEGLVVVQHDRFRRPTGLSAFPDGGQWRYADREGILYRVDAIRGTSTPLVRETPPDSLWESFTVWIHGLSGDSVVFVRLTGCARGGECHPALRNTIRLRVDRRGETRVLRDFPPASGLPGVMLARRPGEERYLRLSSDGRIVHGRFEEDGPDEPLFRVRDDGRLEPVAR